MADEQTHLSAHEMAPGTVVHCEQIPEHPALSNEASKPPAETATIDPPALVQAAVALIPGCTVAIGYDCRLVVDKVFPCRFLFEPASFSAWTSAARTAFSPLHSLESYAVMHGEAAAPAMLSVGLPLARMGQVPDLPASWVGSRTEHGGLHPWRMKCPNLIADRLKRLAHQLMQF
jgi:hypothetical protein